MNCSFLTDPALKADCERRNASGGWASPTLNTSGAAQPVSPMVTSISGTTATTTTPAKTTSTWSSIMGGINDIVGLSGGLMNLYGAYSNVELQKQAAEAQIAAGQQNYKPVTTAQTQQQQPMAGFQLASLGGVGGVPQQQAASSTDMKKMGMIALAGVGGLIAIVLVTNTLKK